MLFQMGEFSFILADQGMQLGLMTPVELQYLLSVTILSLALTPIVYKVAPSLGYNEIYSQIIPGQFQNIAKQVRGVLLSDSVSVKLDDPSLDGSSGELSGHSIIIGFGVAGQNLATALNALKIPYAVCDMNNETVEKFRKKGEPIIFGDATKEEILHQLHLETASLVVLTVSGSKVTGALQRAIKKMRPDVQIIIRFQYLRDIQGLEATDKTEMVVAEVETSIEILSRTLAAYGVDQDDVQTSVINAKQSLLNEMEKVSAAKLVSRMEIPAWQAFSYLRPFMLKEGDFACGKNLLELDVRKNTGASIVALYRDQLGTSLPDLSTEFLAGDTVYLMGNQSHLEKTKEYLRTGYIRGIELDPETTA